MEPPAKRRCVPENQAQAILDRLRLTDAAAASVVVAKQLLALLDGTLEQGSDDDVKLLRTGQITMPTFLNRSKLTLDKATAARLELGLAVFRAAGDKVGGPVATECVVCLAPCSEPITPACGHIMCGGHLDRIVATTDACPKCRGPLSDIRRIYL